MCSHYESPQRLMFVDLHGVGEYLDAPPDAGRDLFPGQHGFFVRRPAAAGEGDPAVPRVEAVAGRWGLVSALTPRAKLPQAEKLSTFNSRSDRVARSFTFGNAWKRGQHCIVPATAFYEPDWRTGVHVPTRFTTDDGEPWGIAGLWDTYSDAGGALVESYTMMTVNADDHALMRNYHRPQAEKRMLVLLPRAQWGEWLDATPERAVGFMRQYPAERIVATATAPTTRPPAARPNRKKPPEQGALL